MTVGLHFNSQHSIHFPEGDYDNIAAKLLNGINADTYYLEYDTERAGTFELLKHLSKRVTSSWPHHLKVLEAGKY
jgi:hypothetical protein